MGVENEILKKISDTVYQEASPPADRHRPLEWRRSFNFTRLPLKRIRVVTKYNVQDSDWNLEGRNIDSPWKLIKPNICTIRSISALVDIEEMKDTIYCAVTENKEQSTTILQRPPGDMHVTLKTGTPVEGEEKFPAGIYHGICFRTNFEPGEDGLCFEMQVPADQLNDILELLKRDPDATIQAGVNLLSFSYEVDDALREWYHPRDLFIEESSPAPLQWINTTSLVGAQLDKVDEVADECESNNSNNEPPGNPPTAQVPIDLSPVTKALSSLTIVLWVLVVVVGIWLIR